MTMIKRHNHISSCATALAVAAFFVTPAALPAQGLLDSGVFDVGGGLLVAPPPDSALTAGTGGTVAGGGAGGPAATGPRGGGGVDQGTGPLLTARVSLGYFFEDEEDEPTESYLGGRFDLGIFTETRNQTFRFNVGAEGRIEEGMSDLTDPFARLNYTISNRPTLFSVDLNWRESDVGAGFLPADFDGDDLIIDSGTEEVHSARITLITGRDRRFGTTTSLGFSQLDYTDTVNPALVNETTLDASTELRFSLDRRVELTVFGDWSERSEDDAVQTTDTDLRYGAGVDVLIDRAWTGSVDLALTREETETLVTTTIDDGYEIDLGLTRTMRNGSLAFSLSRDATEDDGVNSFSATRRMDLPGGAAVSGTIGLVSFDDGDVLPTLGLTYSNEILRGSVLSLSLDQSGGQNDDDVNLVRTTFNATLNQELTRQSRLAITGALASVDIQDGPDPDTLAASLGIVYTYDLTEDWALATRANTRLNYEDGTQTDREDTFSISLERTFSLRP